MILHGFPFTGHSFEWDDSREYTPDEMSRIEESILRNYKVDPQYFIDRYNIPITAEREQTSAFSPSALANLDFFV
jgi:hypothetical protein